MLRKAAAMAKTCEGSDNVWYISSATHATDAFELNFPRFHV